MSSERLISLPLGGAGEIGMNAYVYGYGPQDAERLIVVDLGVTFPDMDTTPGVDLILPDIAWLEARKDQIEGIFIPHAWRCRENRGHGLADRFRPHSFWPLRDRR